MMTPDDLQEHAHKLMDFLLTLDDGNLTLIEGATVIGVVTSALLRLLPKAEVFDFVVTLITLLPSEPRVDTLQ